MAVQQWTWTTYAGYRWADDNYPGIKAGLRGGVILQLVGATRVQGDDCLTTWSLGQGNLDYYHIHFQTGSQQVRAVRYFTQSSDQGTNVVELTLGPRRSVGNLARLCFGASPPYVNTGQLLEAFAALLPGGQDWICR